MITTEAEDTFTRIYPAPAVTAGTATKVAVGNALFWGAQFEAAASPSSYIPTTTAAVARAADVLAYVASGHVAAAAGTMFLAVTPIATTASGFVWDISADADNEFWLQLNAGKPQVKIERATAEQANLTATSAIAAGTTAVVTVVWDANDVRLYVDGGDEKSDTSATMPAAVNAKIYIGSDIGSANHANLNAAHGLIYNRAFTAGDVKAQSYQILEWMHE